MPAEPPSPVSFAFCSRPERQCWAGVASCVVLLVNFSRVRVTGLGVRNGEDSCCDPSWPSEEASHHTPGGVAGTIFQKATGQNASRALETFLSFGLILPLLGLRLKGQASICAFRESALFGAGLQVGGDTVAGCRVEAKSTMGSK